MNDTIELNDEISLSLKEYEDAQWMYFISKPRCEKKLFEALKQQDVPTYLPLLPKTTEYAHRVYNRTLPMFPRYVFAATRSQGFDIRYLNNSLYKVNFLSELSAKELLNDLKIVRQYEILANDFKIEVCPEIKENAPVIITKGIFKGELGFVERRKKNQIITINISSVNSSLRVELPIDWVNAL